MFNICWDSDINGIILCKSCDKPLNISPRPVFKEELDILGFDNYWKYPKNTEYPLLWALGRRYYYKGIMVAEVRGGNLFEASNIIITEEGKYLTLNPINIKKVIEKNKEALFILENEAMDFVLDTYKKFKNKVDFIAVAFSGGKDSQVVLDIVSRILPPDDYIIVFSDTTMELPFTYEIVENTKEEYQKKYPNLKFYTVKPPKPAIEFWEDFGPPSRIHRWCCTVTKTAPFVNFISELHQRKDGKKMPKILVFDGVRAEESRVRSGYSRVGLNTKYIRQINAEAIQQWNTSEIFLYIFYRNINFNLFYKYGLERVGCSICPFSSSKSEFFINKIFSKKIEGFLKIIEKMTINRLKCEKFKIINDYIKQGQWKKRAGGRDLFSENYIVYDFFKNKITVKIKNLDLNKFKEFIKIIGEIYFYENSKQGYLSFEIKTKDNFIKMNIIQGENEYIIEIYYNSYELINLIKKIINKSVYCVGCRACEILCPKKAIKFFPNFFINGCIHCLECLSIEQGCFVAKSLNISENSLKNLNERDKQMEKITGNRYQTFGLREDWFNLFMGNPEEFIKDIKLSYNILNKKIKKTFDGKTGLGLYQIVSMSVWLREAEILNDEKQLNNSIFCILQELWKINNKNVWEIIITNMYFNSKIFKWYLDNFQWNIEFSKHELEKKLIIDDCLSSKRSITNDLNAFLKTLNASPIGKVFNLGKIVDEKQKIIKKEGTSDISILGIYYNLLKTSSMLGTSKFRLSQFFSPDFFGGPYRIFGINQNDLAQKLFSIQEKNPKLLRVEFTADLDNINMTETNIEALKSLV